jgi:hypothetical protein
MSNKKRRCKGVKPDGEQCKKAALPDSDYCHSHDPRRAEARIKNGRKGGLCPRRPDLPEREELTVQQSRQLLAACAEKLIQGKLSSNVARSLAYILQTDRILKEHGEVIARLEQLEGNVH